MRKLFVTLLQLLNVFAMAAATAGAAVGGAMGLTELVNAIPGLKSNDGVSMVGLGLGGLAGFFLWALPVLWFYRDEHDGPAPKPL